MSLVIALGGCWFAYMQHKYSKTHMKRMLTEMENLQKAEESLLQLQDKLKNAQQEQESVYEEKKSLEQKYHDEIETAKREAERLKKAREGSMEEISRLKLAEEELAQVRVALRRAEKELERNQWSAPTELKLWLQLTHEMEVQYFNNKKREAEKYFIAARDECDKVRKKRGTFLGPLRVAHSNSIDTVDQHIDEARTKLEEVRCILQERLQRWNRIEHICGFPIVSNPGLDNLQQILHRDVDIAGSNKYSPSLLANIDVEDAELDEDPPPGYPQAAMLFHSTLANGLPRPPPYPAGYPPGLHRRPQQLSSSTIPRPQPKKTTSLGSMRSGRSETSPTTSSPNGVSERPVFTLDASSPESPVSPVIPAEHLESQVGLLNLKMATMPRSQTTSIISASVLSKRDSQGNTSLPASSSSVTSSVPMEKRSQSDADLLHSMKCGVTHMGNFDSLEESDSGSNSLGVNGHTKKKKLKMPKFFSRKDKQKTS
ncbi:hypothetical protein KUTeg_025057 [Tegillarca granosa]|uniref:STIM1/2 Orai1-activating region domain-containing protein n=1 Tax=Tegillarca granosa TaxID=220873 RepID=A0ABQ9E454_TEGGR|nr:hypothetical protein KUTeg_025057 [Tegillarca granosa]